PFSFSHWTHTGANISDGVANLAPRGNRTPLTCSSFDELIECLGREARGALADAVHGECTNLAGLDTPFPDFAPGCATATPAALFNPFGVNDSRRYWAEF